MNYCITGLMPPEFIKSLETPKSEAVVNNENVYKYFTDLGYKVLDDFSSRTCECWHEIYGDKGLICQIDKGIPLNDILEDLKCIAEGKDGTSKSDYKICLPENEETRKFLENVKNHE